MSEYCIDFIEKYDEILTKLKVLFNSNGDIINNIHKSLDLSKEDKLKSGVDFCNLINQNNLHAEFKLRRIKIFSSKDKLYNNISSSLFKCINLKKIFNKRDDYTKSILWDYIHLLYSFSELAHNKKPDLDYINGLMEDVKSHTIERSDDDNNINNILNFDVNDRTNNMLNDIVATFKKNSDSGESPNPMNLIMGITKKISSEYGSDIQNGNIDLENLLGQMTKSLPGFEQLGDMKGMDLSGLSSILGGMTKNQKKEDVIIDDNFSTDQIKVGEDETDNPFKNFNIGQAMKMLDSMKGTDNPLSKLLNTNENEEEDVEGGEVNDENMAELSNNLTKMLKDQFNINMDDFAEQMNEIDKNMKKQDVSIDE
jgi:hypothetical protein